MKIALIILHADPSRGGAERYTFDLAGALAKRGHDVWLLSTARCAQDYVIERRAGEPFRRVRLKTGGLSRSQSYRRFLKSLDRFLHDETFDIVHSMLPVHHCSVYQPHAGIAAENLRSGHRKEPHQIAQGLTWVGNRWIGRRKLVAAVEREMLTAKKPPTVICLSNAQKQIVLDHYPSIGKHLVRLFNAVDLNKFDPTGRADARAAMRKQLKLKDEQVLALLISQNWELKGVRQAIEALAKVTDPRLVLAIVGKENPRTYEALAKSLGVANRVRFPGPTSDAPAFYRAADFFVLPTRSDVCSLVVLEALTMGLPVISTAANGACEIMTDGVHGLILPDPQDVLALAERMGRLLDASARSRMSAASLQLRTGLSYDEHLDHLIQIYEQSRVYSASAIDAHR